MTVAALAEGLKALTAAAWRAGKRDDKTERDRLLDEAFAQLDRMIEAGLPSGTTVERRFGRWADVLRKAGVT